MRNIHIGLIGGGQLGMLLVQKAIEFPVRVSVFDPNPTCSAAYFTHQFVQGDFDDYEAVLTFGRSCDVILFEIEKVNLDALLQLQKEGKKVISDPRSLAWIQDKSTQRQKLKEAGFPVPQFTCIAGSEIQNYTGPFPIVQKYRRDGYDGQGVVMHKDKASFASAKAIDSVLEEKIHLKHELSILVARTEQGEVAIYPPIEMVFDPQAHLVDYLIAPARVSQKVHDTALDIVRDMASKFDFVGIHAVELFVDQDDNIFVNEIAPRPHNSGHHTVSANVTSQYEQQIRIALGLPLGSVDMLSPCVLANLLGAGGPGVTHYQGMNQAYQIPNIQYTFYGKEEVRPYRKMGHALILEPSVERALESLETLKKTLTITSHE